MRSFNLTISSSSSRFFFTKSATVLLDSLIFTSLPCNLNEFVIEPTMLSIEDERSPSNNDPDTIRYIGTSLIEYPNKVIEAVVGFWVAKTAASIPKITKSIKISIFLL